MDMEDTPLKQNDIQNHFPQNGTDPPSSNKYHDEQVYPDVNEKLLITSKSPKYDESGRIDTVEELYSALGSPGLFAKIVFVVACFNMVTIGSNHAAGVFLDYSPAHVCHAMEKTANNSSAHSINGSSSSSSLGLVPDSGQIIYSECTNTYMSDGTGNVTRRCRKGQWKYGVKERESSSVTEWDLVCDQANKAHLSSTLYFGGVMAGGLMFGFISDILGRRWGIIVSLYMAVGLGAGIAFTHNLVVYIVLRTLMGVAIQGFLTATYIRLLELFGPKFRGFAGNALYCVWGLSLNYLGLMAWLLKSWRLIQLACIAQAVVGIFYIWMIPESLRWLVAKGRVKDASRLTGRIYRINKCTDTRCLDPTLMSRLVGEKTVKSSSVFDLFRETSLLRRTAILGYVTLAVNFGYWGLTYNTQALVGNRYQNFVLSTIPEIFVYLANIFVLNRFGRKRPMMFYFFVTAVCCLISCLLSTTSGSVTMNTVVLVVSTIGRLTACGLMGTNDVFMAELYPTLVRNSGVGVCTCLGRIGAVITPIIFTLTKVTFQGLPLLSFGVVTAIAVFMTMLLPDTWKRDLPETLHDLEMTVQVSPTPVPEKDALLLENNVADTKQSEMVA